MLSTSFSAVAPPLLICLVLSTSWVNVRGQHRGCEASYEDAEAEVRKPNKAARERFEAAFPFLKGYNSSSANVWHVVSADGDYVGELNCSDAELSGFQRYGNSNFGVFKFQKKIFRK